MTVLTTFSNGGNNKDFRDTFNSMLARITALEGGTATPTLTLTGRFYLNGSTNPTWKAALTGVKNGTRRGRVSIVADSTLGAGTGSGSMVATASGTNQGLGNARQHRFSKLLAASYTAAGVPMLDTGVYGDNGTGGGGRYNSSGCDLPIYDPRLNNVIGRALTYPNWAQNTNEAFGGGALLAPASNVLTFAPTEQVDTFEVTVYAGVSGTGGFNIDNAAPASGSAGVTLQSGYATYTMPAVHSSDRGGPCFFTYTLKTAAPGTHVLGMNGPNDNSISVRSIFAYNSATPTIDIRNMGAGGATSADQSTAGADSGGIAWNCLDALGYDAPDLTIISLGINDGNTGVTPAAYSANLQKIITKAKLTGDVLLVLPYPVGSSTDAVQQALNSAGKSLAASNNIACLSLLDYYGPYSSTIAARTQGDGVHWTDYTEPTALVKQALDAMAA